MVCTLLLLKLLWCLELGILSVSNDACQCKFLSTMKLPCRHMFAVREKGVSLLSARDIADCWKMSYLQQVFGSKNHEAAANDETDQVTPVIYIMPVNYIVVS